MFGEQPVGSVKNGIFPQHSVSELTKEKQTQLWNKFFVENGRYLFQHVEIFCMLVLLEQTYDTRSI
jgi:hypothetical protein